MLSDFLLSDDKVCKHFYPDQSSKCRDYFESKLSDILVAFPDFYCFLIDIEIKKKESTDNKNNAKYQACKI